MTELVLAADKWVTNGDLIADCAWLGYLKPNWYTLDPTYGRGLWWSQWQPNDLVTKNRPTDGSDFRKLDFGTSSFDAIAYDPPYMAKGGRTTSTIDEMDDRYGLEDCPPTPALLQELINDGLTEMHRIVRPCTKRGAAGGGIVLVKCMSYVSGGRFWPGANHTLNHAFEVGFELVDMFQHIGKPGPQSQVTQVHARNNYSTLYVLQKQRKKKVS